MHLPTILLIAKQFWVSTFKSRAIYPIILLMTLMLAYAAYSGWKNYTTQNAIRTHYQQVVRDSWESNPDKHPHRMAHYGSFAFRLKSPLSLFDFGLESFTGNAVFLEAHKQNTVNFSEASFSTGLLRFGEISLAMLLQILLPLIVFFLGFATVAAERENGTLKILLIQGAGWKDILLGKTLGLMALTLLFFLPVVAVVLLSFTLTDDMVLTSDVWGRYAATTITYLLFFLVICIITVLISTFSRSPKDALIRLLGIWLFLAILLPRTTQALGNYFYPSPSKVEFEAVLEEDLLKEGDSHNPDDPHFMALKDSLLQSYQVSSTEELPFNYSGYVMREGERMSAHIYDRHLQELLSTYQQQNRFTQLTAFINPFVAVKGISMALAGTDFESYADFQQQAEEYRYQLAQEMNELQMEYISNTEVHDEPQVISNDHWQEFPDFQHQFLAMSRALASETLSIVALLVWSIAAVVLLLTLSQKAKAL